MNTSECLINSLSWELDSLTTRIENIKNTYLKTTHNVLRDRLIFENISILKRVNEITSIAKLIEKRSNNAISLSSLLVEKCNRANNEMKRKNNLFFL